MFRSLFTRPLSRRQIALIAMVGIVVMAILGWLFMKYANFAITMRPDLFDRDQSGIIDPEEFLLGITQFTGMIVTFIALATFTWILFLGYKNMPVTPSIDTIVITIDMRYVLLGLLVLLLIEIVICAILIMQIFIVVVRWLAENEILGFGTFIIYRKKDDDQQ